MKVNKALRRRQANDSRMTRPLQALLAERAVERCAEQGHTLSAFTDAKRKFGRSVQKALCEHCGEMVLIHPFMEYSREYKQVPAIEGDILFQKCHRV